MGWKPLEGLWSLGDSQHVLLEQEQAKQFPFKLVTAGDQLPPIYNLTTLI